MTRSRAISETCEIARLAITPVEVSWSVRTFHWTLALGAQCGVLGQHDLARELRLRVGSLGGTARLPASAAWIGVHRLIVPLRRPEQKKAAVPARRR